MFLDIGGVLLTDGWDHRARQRAATNFQLNFAEIEDRHRLTFQPFEEGKLTLMEYLNLTIFYEERSFSADQFREYMFEQSKPYSEMIELFSKLKINHRLKIVVVSNEARELNSHRIHTFKLNELVDCFVSSCFVHLRKPDADIFRLALDISQTPSEQILFIDNTAMFVEIAAGLGMRGIQHVDYASTRAKLASFGLSVKAGGRDEVC